MARYICINNFQCENQLTEGKTYTGKPTIPPYIQIDKDDFGNSLAVPKSRLVELTKEEEIGENLDD